MMPARVGHGPIGRHGRWTLACQRAGIVGACEASFGISKTALRP